MDSVKEIIKENLFKSSFLTLEEKEDFILKNESNFEKFSGDYRMINLEIINLGEERKLKLKNVLSYIKTNNLSDFIIDIVIFIRSNHLKSVIEPFIQGKDKDKVLFISLYNFDSNKKVLDKDTKSIINDNIYISYQN